jgi:hypothetical protein
LQKSADTGKRWQGLAGGWLVGPVRMTIDTDLSFSGGYFFVRRYAPLDITCLLAT